MLKLMYKLNRIYMLVNKYIYILPLISMISNLSYLRDNKFFKLLKTIIKIIVIVTIVLSGFLWVYFADFATPLNNTYSLYYDLLEPYIELIKHFWNKLISLFNDYFSRLPDPNSQIKNELESAIRESTSQIRNEVKVGIKEGLIEAINEMPEDKPNYFKSGALICGTLLIGYILLILPSNPETISEYNWINQSLIESKIVVKEFIQYLIGNPGNSGNTGNPSNTVVSPISPTNLDIYFPIQTSNSGGSEGLSTITPNTPILFRNLVDVGTQTEVISKTFTNVEMQTYTDGLTVSRSIETINILADVLDEETTTKLLKGVSKNITNITDG